MGWYPWTVLALLPGWLIGQGQAGRERDAGTFAVSVNGARAGREEFVVREGRPQAREGFTITTRRYAEDGGDPALVATTELRPDSQAVTVQLTDARNQRRVFVGMTPRRVTVRTVHPAGESVREYRGADPLLLADDALAAWFAFPPPAVPSVAVVWPREDRREVLTLADRGLEPTAVGVDTVSLRHLVLGSGPLERHLWYDARGRLTRFEAPQAGLVAVRTTP